MQIEPNEPELVMSFKTIMAQLPVAGAPGLEEVKCVRFCGSRFTETVLVLRQAMTDKLERMMNSPPTGAHFESALRATFPAGSDFQAKIADLKAAIARASEPLAPPFNHGVSRSEIAAREVMDLVMRVDAVGTHFWLDATLPNEQEVSLLFSAIMLSVLNENLS